MVPMMVRPHNGTNRATVNVNTILLQDRSYIFIDMDLPLQSHPFFIGGIFFPVFAHSQVEENWSGGGFGATMNASAIVRIASQRYSTISILEVVGR
ncbi:hypothetical protein AC579_936 [Pseudocercospora musae]|uniref:Uncharacterized protein n=1 Tax=Pseudocercospora musae TaxID=113226 RepID=A0A139IU92_9PEZI|nr:hypothetical protein AC579_936 [Pseudocercospora musae]